MFASDIGSVVVMLRTLVVFADPALGGGPARGTWRWRGETPDPGGVALPLRAVGPPIEMKISLFTTGPLQPVTYTTGNLRMPLFLRTPKT